MADAKPSLPSECQQPALFKPEQLPPVTEAVVEAAERYLHSGKITCKDEERAARIIESFLLSGRNKLATARACGCSPNSIEPIFQRMEAMGKLDDIIKRLGQKLSLLAELSTEAAIEMIVAGKVPANALYPLIGVPLDKKAQLEGAATAGLTVRVEIQPVQVSDLANYLLSQGVQPPIDVQSTVSTVEPAKTK